MGYSHWWKDGENKYVFMYFVFYVLLSVVTQIFIHYIFNLSGQKEIVLPNLFYSIREIYNLIGKLIET